MKYNTSKKTSGRTYNNIVFDSVMEMEYYRDVVLPLFQTGEITYFELQKPYILQPKFTHNGKTIRRIDYVADFYIEYNDDRIEVIDIKGCADSIAKIKRKMFWYTYPAVTYKWLTYAKKYGGWCDWDEVQKLRAQNKKERLKKKKENDNGTDQ